MRRMMERNALRVAGLVAALLAVAAVAGVLVLGCDDDDSAPSATPSPSNGDATPTTPTAARTIETCPVERELCDFGLQLERWIRDGEIDRIVAPGTGWDNANDRGVLAQSIDNVLVERMARPRFAGVGCPLLDGAADCGPAFSLVITTLFDRELSIDGTGTLILGFERRAGQPPALTGVSIPDERDRITVLHAGGRTTGCNASGLPPRTGDECILAEIFLVEVTSTGAPPDCPVVVELCERALEVERQIRAKDYAGVASGTELEPVVRERVPEILGDGEPQLVTIGCPFGNIRASCEEGFALVFTTLDPADDWTEPGGLAILRFQRDVQGSRLEAVDQVVDIENRRPALMGGMSFKQCDLAGEAPEGEGPGGCSRGLFVPFWSQEQWAPPRVEAIEAFELAAGREQLPANSVIYTVTGCYQCDGPDETLQRHYTPNSGVTETATILESGKGVLEGLKIGRVEASPDGGLIAAVACDREYCGGMGQLPNGEWRVLWSLDGGESWSEAWRGQAANVNISNPTSAGFVLWRFAWNDETRTSGEERFELVTLSGRSEIERPAAAGERGWPALLSDGSVLWTVSTGDSASDNGVVRGDGTRPPYELPPGVSVNVSGSTADGVVGMHWHDTAARESVFGTFDASGARLAAFRTENVYHILLRDTALAVGNISHRTLADPGSSYPALFDLKTGTVTPFLGPFRDIPGRNRFIAYRIGPFARVTGTGDCLNVREEPATSAASLGCFRDGVLLQDVEETTEAGAITWLRVATPAGSEGWASVEYLER